VHLDICGYHSGARTMVARMLRDRYFWPTMETNSAEYVKNTFLARSTTTLFTTSKKKCTISSPCSPLQSGEWISLIILHQAKA